MPNSSSYKAQFFILTVAVAIAILYLFSLLAKPESVVDVSTLVIKDEYFIFQDIAEEAKETVKKVNDCKLLNYSLQEFKNYVENYGNSRNWKISLNYSFSSCNQAVIPFNLSLESYNKRIFASFNASRS